MLQNNNQSMQTVVETFLVEETMNLIHDNDSLILWNEKVDQLGLQGQKEIVKTEKSPIPYLWMNNALVATFETLCPTKVNIEKYNRTAIPLEILDLVAMSRNEKHFDFVQIWFNEVDKDPVCIGFTVPEENKNQSEWYQVYYSQKYLIGRWADVKASLDTLIKKARLVFIANTKSEHEKSIRDHQRNIEDLEHTANGKFGGAMPSSTELPF